MQAVWFVCGCIAHTLAWIPVMAAFFLGVAGSDAPGAVKAIAPVLFSLFACFACVQGYTVLQPKTTAHFRRAEMGYIILSFVSKTVLSALVYSGVAARSSMGIEVRG